MKIYHGISLYTMVYHGIYNGLPVSKHDGLTMHLPWYIFIRGSREYHGVHRSLLAMMT